MEGERGWQTPNCACGGFPTTVPGRRELTTLPDTRTRPMAEQDDDKQRTENRVPAGSPASKASRWWLRGVALGVPALILFSKLGASGIWDPHELNTADMARRIAIHVWGAKSLELASADSSMPTLEMLGKGELPFTSIALGFASFGLHEWAGRLPLALWAMAGVLALFWLFKRMFDERAATYATVVLATMPLYFVHARTMLGDIVTMASVAVAVSGLTVAAFDRLAGVRVRLVAGLIGLVGIAAAFLSRGAIIGIAAPLLTIGFAWLVLSASSRRPASDLPASIVGVVGLVIGLVVCGYAVALLHGERAAASVRMLGSAIAPPPQQPTFDYVIMYLGHGLFPWSAFVPFAIGRLYRPPVQLEEPAAERERAMRVVLLLGAAFTFGASAVMAPRVGYVPYAGPAFLAGIAAIAFRDLERGAAPSRTLAIGVATFLALFLLDFKAFPDKALSAYGVTVNGFPESFKTTATTLLRVCTAAFATLLFAGWIERDSDDKKPFDRQEWTALPRFVRSPQGASLVFGAILVETTLVAFAVMFFLGHLLKWKSFVAMGATWKMVALNAWWVVPVAVPAAIVLALAFRDVCRWFFKVTRLSRGAATLVGGAAAGAILAFAYYPALAAQLSPKEVFESYAKLHGAGEPLALLGVNSRTASYYSGGDPQTFSDPDSAVRWLTEDPSQRRWLVLRSDDLARVNSLFRARAKPAINIPILDARSSSILLASNLLRSGDTSTNPFSSVVLDGKPRPTHPLDVDLQGQLLALGWDIVDLDGKPVEWVVAGRKYRIRLYYQVTSRITNDWECFIHIDGYQRRYNGDHKPIQGKYPMTLWQPGDYVVDDYELQLEPNFTPGGYTLFYGFFQGETRLKVVRGKHNENRIEGGIVQVQ